MKSNSLLLVLSGFAIGAIAGVLLAPEKSLKKKKGPANNFAKKSLKETASKYEKQLREMEL